MSAFFNGQKYYWVDSDSTLLVEISSDVMNNAILTCDGDEPVAIPTDTKVAVSVSEYKARLVKVKTG